MNALYNPFGNGAVNATHNGFIKAMGCLFAKAAAKPTYTRMKLGQGYKRVMMARTSAGVKRYHYDAKGVRRAVN